MINQTPPTTKFSTGTIRVFGADTLTKIFETLLSIYVARSIGPLPLGHLIILLALSGYAEKFGRLSLDQAAVYLLGKERCSFRQAHRTLTLTSIILCLPWIILGLTLKDWISLNFLKAPDISLSAYLLALSHIPVSFLLINSRKLLTQASEVTAYNQTVWPIPVIQILILLLAGAWMPHLTLETVIFSSLASQTLVTLYAHSKLWKLNPNPERFNPVFLPELIKWGWNFYQTMIPQFLQIRIDILLTAYFLNPTQTAYYSLAATASQLLWRLPQVTNVLFYPMSAKMNDQEAGQFAVNITRQLALWMTLLGIGAAICIYPAVHILYGERYLDLVPAFLILLPGTIMMGMAKSLYEYFNARGLTQLTRQTATITLIGNVVLNLILLPILGIKGAALTSSLTYALTWILLMGSFLKKTKFTITSFFQFNNDIHLYAKLIKSSLDQAAQIARRHGFKIVFLSALLVRAIIFIGARDIDYGFSTGFKLADTARNFLEGRGLVWNPQYLELINKASLIPDPLRPRLELFDEIPTSLADTTQLEPFRGRPPGYSLVLAATWKIFGAKKFIYSQAIFCFLDLIACLIIWWIAKNLFGPMTAFMAGMLYALSLSHATLSIFTTHDAIGSVLIAAALALFLKSVQESSSWPMIFSGLAIGLSSLVRQEPFVLPGVFLIASTLSGLFRKNFLKIVASQIIVIICVLPWGFRNKKVLGEFTLFMPAYGGNLLGGIGDYRNPWGVEANDQWLKKFVHSQGNKYPYHSKEFNTICMNEFKRIFQENPAWVLRSMVRRTLTALMPTIMPFERTYTRYYRQRLKKDGMINYAKEFPVEFLVPILSKVLWLALWLLSALALWKIIQKSNPTITVLSWTLAGTTLYYLISHVPMHLEYRFLLPGYFSLMILGAQGLKILVIRAFKYEK